MNVTGDQVARAGGGAADRVVRRGELNDRRRFPPFASATVPVMSVPMKLPSTTFWLVPASSMSIPS